MMWDLEDVASRIRTPDYYLDYHQYRYWSDIGSRVFRTKIEVLEPDDDLGAVRELYWEGPLTFKAVELFHLQKSFNKKYGGSKYE